MTTPDLVFRSVGVAGFEPTASSSRTRDEGARYLRGYLSPQACRWSALLRRGAVERFMLDHLPDFSQRETGLHVPCGCRKPRFRKGT
jgi:hypothetical protein